MSLLDDTVPRKLTYWQDTVGAIATFLGLCAGVTNLLVYWLQLFGTAGSDLWLVTWIVELVW